MDGANPAQNDWQSKMASDGVICQSLKPPYVKDGS